MSKEKLEQMKLKKRLNHGYSVVISIMLVSGLISVLLLGVLFGSLGNYAKGPQKADDVVKKCRIDINVAARTLREMTLNTDSGTYDQYKATIEENLEDIGVQLEILKKTDIISDELYQKYETSLSDWGNIGYDIIDEIVAGNQDEAVRKIFDECVPALDNVVTISKEIDVQTSLAKETAITKNQLLAVAGIVFVIIFIIAAVMMAKRLGKRIINSVLTPLREIEAVAGELAAGNLHSKLEYHSTDEIGILAHNLRKSIRILGSYIDDIARSMKEFSDGNFDVKPEVNWKGDFEGIYDSFMSFEESMAETVKGIQRVADQVTGGAQQVAASSMDLAEGATEQAGITKELTATVDSTSAQVYENAESAKQISMEVANTEKAIANSNGKMQEMVGSMQEINNASTEISKIIATINDIASQTNLLALNASIEAARAGEAGKGFAVVADQVSVLAAQSAEAAKESTILIKSSINAVEKGMVIADETAQQLEKVVEDSRVMTESVNKIAVVLKEQAESIVMINKGIENINDVVQTNSATSEECAAASQEMSGLAETLEELIRKLRVK